MQMQQNPQQQFVPNRPEVIQPPRPKKRYRFRWWIITIPLSIVITTMIAQMILGSINPLAWNRFLGSVGIRNKTLINQLICLGIILTSVVAIVKVLRSSDQEEK